MEPTFEYGISQEDSRVDARALDLRDGDRLLCISSAGEMPLNLLAMFDIKISAVDILESQNCLTRLKLAATRSLDPEEAASPPPQGENENDDPELLGDPERGEMQLQMRALALNLVDLS